MVAKCWWYLVASCNHNGEKGQKNCFPYSSLVRSKKYNTGQWWKKASTLAERKTVPELGCSSPAISLSMVDFPMPFGPTTEVQLSREMKLLVHVPFFSWIAKKVDIISFLVS